MYDAGLEVDVVSYSAVIDACSRCNDGTRARAVFDKMKAHGVKPSIITYTSLARPFARQGDVAAVEAIHQEMRTQGFRMNDYFLNVVLVACASARPRNCAKAEQIFREAVSEGVRLNEYVFTSLEKALGRECARTLANEVGKSVEEVVRTAPRCPKSVPRGPPAERPRRASLGR
jgi:pentatricopeptide repeat protein